MTHNKGFRFRPTFASDIIYFEVDHFDKTTNMVHTIVHTIGGHTFEDDIEKEYYDNAFEIGEYMPSR